MSINHLNSNLSLWSPWLLTHSPFNFIVPAINSNVVFKHTEPQGTLRYIDVWKVYKNRMWSTITSPTNSTKKLIVVQKHAKLGEPQLITVASNCSNETKNIGNGGRVEEAQLFRQGGGLRRFRNTRRANNCWERDIPVLENQYQHQHQHQVTTTLSKGNSGPAKVVLTCQRSGDNKAPVTPA